jgi:hypothetical protein
MDRYNRSVRILGRQHPKRARANLIRRFFAVATLILCAVMFYAGLRPRGFRLLNDVSWIPAANGISFHKMGLAYTEHPIPLPGQSLESASVELAIKLNEQPNSRMATILYFWDDPCRETLELSQWRKTLIVRKRYLHLIQDTNLEIGRTTDQRRDHFIVIASRRGEGTVLYIDGIRGASSSLFTIFDSAGSLGRLTIGGSGDAQQRWNGDIYALTIYDRLFTPEEVETRSRIWKSTASLPPAVGAIVTYSFDEHNGNVAHDRSGKSHDLRIPDFLNIPQKRVLSMPWKDFQLSASYFNDVVINLAGFVPFGFFFCAWMTSAGGMAARHRLMWTVFAGFCISLLFEMVQVFIPTRSSQLTDLITNTFGTFIGAYAVARLSSWLGLERGMDRSRL